MFIFNKQAPLIRLSSWASVHKHLGIKLVSKLKTKVCPTDPLLSMETRSTSVHNPDQLRGANAVMSTPCGYYCGNHASQDKQTHAQKALSVLWVPAFVRPQISLIRGIQQHLIFNGSNFLTPKLNPPKLNKPRALQAPCRVTKKWNLVIRVRKCLQPTLQTSQLFTRRVWTNANQSCAAVCLSAEL